jgi:hypothetical protein
LLFWYVLALAVADYMSHVVDGPKAVKYTDDLASCHSLSDEREYINGDEKS